MLGAGTLFAQRGVTGKITADLMEEINGAQGSNELMRVIIVMSEQYDAQESMRQTRYFDRAQKRDFVVEELQRLSAATQTGVLNELKQAEKVAMVENVRPLWIINAVCCSMNRDMVYAISERPDVKYISTDMVVSIPDGEDSSEPLSDRSELQWNVIKVNADDVWAMGYTGAGIVVAVIDTGVNYNHTDIANNMWDGGSEYPNHGWDFVNNDNDPMDDHSHGTHCAGTVSSYGTSGKQCGIAKDAKIMALKVLGSGGSGYDSWILPAIQFAVDHGADVISMSLGADGAGGISSYRSLMENVLAAGVVAAVAAGNVGDKYENGQLKYPVPYNVGSPGNCPPPWHNPDQTLTGGLSAVVTVGATTSSDERSSFSSFGPVTWAEGSSIGSYSDYPYTPGSSTNIGLIKPDVAAPGSYIVSLAYNSNTGYSTKSGTSMATPCIAGVMALMLSADPTLTPAEIDEILETTAVHIQGYTNKNNYTGAGRVDALAAVNACSPLSPDIHFDPTVVNLGYRPIGDWMRPALVEISNLGGAATIQNIQVTNSNYSLDLGGLSFPFNLYYNSAVEVGVNTNSAYAPNAQLKVTYNDNQQASISVSATPYTPVVGDVWELPKVVSSFPFSENINSATKPFYNNYVLPPASLPDGPDAVYKLTFTQDVALTASVTSGANAKMALYAEGFQGVGGPDLENFINVVTGDVNVVFDLVDSWGDGWNGATLMVSYNGYTQNLTLETGSSASYTLAIPYGTQVSLTWISGSYDSECSFTVSYESGDAIYSSSSLSAGLLYQFTTPTPMVDITNFPVQPGVYYLAASSTSNNWSVNINATSITPGVVTGHVYKQDGITPIANATVTIYGDDFFGIYQNVTFTTNASGLFSGSMPKGTFQAKATASGYVETVYGSPVVVDYNTTTSGIDFLMNELIIPVTGVVASYYPNAGNPNSSSVKVTWGNAPTAFSVDFESGLPDGWTVVDGNEDGWTWCLTSDIPSTWTYYASITLDWYHSGSNAICSGSYINGAGPLTPDEYLISPQVVLTSGSQLSFWAAATDTGYPADHFGVFVSDNGTSGWTLVQEWTLTAKKEMVADGGRASRDSKGKTLGTWYNYTVDLSPYAGPKYIAFRHFDCYDQYIMCLDDITLTDGSKGRTVYEHFNGFVTDPGAMDNGADASWTKNGQSTFGPSANNGGGYKLADSFTLTETTTITDIEVYGYQTGSSTTSTFTGLYAQIYNGNPMSGGSVVWGNGSTNLMSATAFTNCYRGSDGETTATTRPIMSITANGLNIQLEAGTYYLVYSLAGSGSSGPWGVPHSEPGIGNTGNGIQYTSSGWGNLTDTGTGTSYGCAMKLLGLTGSPAPNSYRVYRSKCIGGVSSLIADNVMGNEYIDNSWSSLEEGTYKYGVSASNGGDIAWSNCIEKIAMTGITQTTDFGAGWTWWSTYVEQNDATGLTQLETGLGNNGQLIKSQTASVSNIGGGEWYGTLTALDNALTYRVKTTAAKTVSVTGQAVATASHPVTLNPNWTWIGYPSTTSMTVAQVMAGITPMDGDILKSQSGSATYMYGDWYGALALSPLTPGMGLMYKSNRSTSITLTFPSGAKGEGIPELEPVSTHWAANYTAYPDNMTVMALVEMDGEELQGERYELAAFANGECRGSVPLLYIAPLNRYVAILTVSGDEAAELYFGLYDTETGEEYHNAEEALAYESNAVVGSLDEPYVIRFRSNTGLDDLNNRIQVFPNPVERGQTFNIGMTDAEIGEAQVDVINALGVVLETQSIVSLQYGTVKAPNVPGVYTLRITVEGKGTCYRKLVVK